VLSFQQVLTLPAGCGPAGEDVTELALLLPAGQARALEREARRRGLTVGQLLRSLVADCLRERGGRRPTAPFGEGRDGHD